MEGVHEWRRDRILRRIGLIFGLLSLALLAVSGALAAARQARLSAATARADGVVVKLAGHGRSRKPVVEFTPPGGAPVRFEGNLQSRPPAYDVGEHVQVMYDPGAPERALIDSLWEKWFIPLLLGCLGAPYLLVAAIMLIIAGRLRELERRLRESGDRFAGSVVELKRARAGRHRFGYKLIVEARDPWLGEVHRYASAPARVENPDAVIGCKATVLVDPAKRSRYLVDLSES